jgi:hypothetical protein
MTQELPRFVRDMLASPARRGDGLNNWFFRMARVLHPFRSPQEITELLRAATHGEPLQPNEIKRAVERSAACAWKPGETPATKSRRQAAPQFNRGAFEKFIGHNLVDPAFLEARSPIAPANRTPASFLHALYKPGENIVVFDDYESQGQEVWTHPGLPYDARALDSFVRGQRFGVWFLTNPVDGQVHINDDGKPSRRSHQNVTAWRYLLLESDRDDISEREWLTALSLLPLPIAAITETGGRLAHALIHVDASSKAHWDSFKAQLTPLATVLGADTPAISAVRLSRLPQCQRLGKKDANGKFLNFQDGPRFQRLLYLNPAPDGTPIADQGSQTLHPSTAVA